MPSPPKLLSTESLLSFCRCISWQGAEHVKTEHVTIDQAYSCVRVMSTVEFAVSTLMGLCGSFDTS